MMKSLILNKKKVCVFFMVSGINWFYVELCEELLDILFSKGRVGTVLWRNVILLRSRFRFRCDDDLLTKFWECHDETYKL
jgi:hypothetical protein